MKIPRVKEFDKESSVTKNMLKGKNRNITYDHEQASTLSKSLPSLSSELKKFAIWGYKYDNGEPTTTMNMEIPQILMIKLKKNCELLFFS